jgi:hypothetical protein
MATARSTRFIVCSLAAGAVFAWGVTRPDPGLGGDSSVDVSTSIEDEPEKPDTPRAAPHRVAGFDEVPAVVRAAWVESESPEERAAVDRQRARLDRAHARLRQHRTDAAATGDHETARLVLDAHLARLDRERTALGGHAEAGIEDEP